jgi:hypothetical protein
VGGGVEATVNSKEENFLDFLFNYVQEFGLWINKRKISQSSEDDDNVLFSVFTSTFFVTSQL